MAATPTPSPADAEGSAHAAASAALQRALDQLAADLPALLATTDTRPVAVAFSGGSDSTALLHAARLLAPGRVQAVHVHHGLQPAADRFAAHCEAVCVEWRIPLQVCAVQAHAAPGESPEDAARQARYAALVSAARAGGARCIWLGQHADDQAETLLLALSRGAGLPGLAAMPAVFERGGLAFARPLLSVPAADLRGWLQAQGIAWVEDPTNADTGYTRNRIRHQVLPALQGAFPHFRDTFARSARHAAQAQGLLAEVAREDLARVTAGDLAPVLVLALLQALSRERQANLLRHWLRAVYGQSASAAQMDEALTQIAACQTRGHQIRLRVGTGWLERRGPHLHWQAAV